MSEQTEIFEQDNNPLDNVEEVLNANDWVFNRMNENELIVQVTGKSCEYRLFFIWQEDMNAIQFCCQYDMHIAEENYNAAAKTLMSINEKLWMGHFDLPHDTGVPTFRQTSLIHGNHESNAALETIESMIDISLTQCERYCTAFQMLSTSNTVQATLNDQALSLALMETVGES